MDATHALYVLLDSNLPTGGFVASGGLESYAKHGFLAPEPDNPYGVRAATVSSGELERLKDLSATKASAASTLSSATAAGTAAGTGKATGRATGTGARHSPASHAHTAARPQSAAPLGPSRAGPALVRFTRAELHNFEASTGGYLVAAFRAVSALLSGAAQTRRERGTAGLDEEVEVKTEPGVPPSGPASAPLPPASATSPSVAETVDTLLDLDATHEATLLSHVARRASKAQGVALLTLYARGMVPPPGFTSSASGASSANGASAAAAGLDAGDAGTDGDARQDAASDVVAAYRRAIRLGAPGHMAVCFGVVAACVGLDLETIRHLYLYTHARSTLSAAVRLNVVGPYLSTQLLSFPVRQELAAVLAGPGPGERPHHHRVSGSGSGSGGGAVQKTITDTNGDAAGKPTRPTKPTDTGNGSSNDDPDDPWAWADEAERGPATTWPLGEILAARHDLQHSRIFNS